MARNEYTGVPEVSAELGAPDDYQHVQASPAAFGGAVAQGAEAVGQGIQDATKFYGEVAADNGTNNTLQQVTSVLHGDPNKMVPGPDGALVPDTGYFGKRGADAMSARADTAQHIDEIIQENRESLSTPEAKLQYDTQTRRYRAQWQSQMGEYADNQQRVWATDTNNTTAQLGLSEAARNAADPAAADVAAQKVRTAYVRNAQLNGESADGAVLKADQEVALTRIRSLVVSNPQAAEKVLNDSAGALSSLPNYDQITRTVKGAVIDSQLGPESDSFVASALNDARSHAASAGATGVPNASYLSALSGRESHGSPIAKNPRSSATGKDQFIASTWYDPKHPAQSVMGQPDFASVIAGKTPAEILAMRTDPALSEKATLVYARMNGAQLQADGQPVNAATLGLSHGFGAAGANKILRADPDEPMSKLMPDVISANPDLANKTAGQVVQNFNHRFGTGQVDAQTGAVSGGATQYPSTADALNANMDQTLAAAQKKAEALFPNYPDAQDRFVQRVERGLNRTIAQQHQQYEVDTHIVQAALAGPNAPISEEQLIASSPQVAASWQSMQLNNPYGAQAVERMFDANARGRAVTYGTGFKDYLDRALAPSSDPNRITNSSQLWTFVGAGEGAPLTNTGANALSDLIGARGTPQGEAYATQLKTFVDQMHAEMTFSNPSVGRIDPKGEQVFSRFMAQALPILTNANKNGALSSVLNPKSPDYIGNTAQSFMRTPAQMMKDRVDSDPIRDSMKATDDATQGRYLLKQAVTQGRLSVQQATQIGEDLGYFRKSAAPSPAPAPGGHPLFEQHRDASGRLVESVNGQP